MPDETLRITTQVDVAAISSGMTQAASAVTSSTGQMSAGFAKVAAESLKADAAVTRMGSSMGMARVEAAAVTGSTGMLAGGLARLAAQSSALAPLLAAAFPIALFAAGAEVLGGLVNKFLDAKKATLEQGVAWASIENSMAEYDRSLTSKIGGEMAIIAGFTGGPLAELDAKFKNITVDVDGLGAHFTGLENKFIEMTDKANGLHFTNWVEDLLTLDQTSEEAINQSKEFQMAWDLAGDSVADKQKVINDAMAKVAASVAHLHEVTGSEKPLAAFAKWSEILNKLNGELAKTAELAQKQGEVVNLDKSNESMLMAIALIKAQTDEQLKLAEAKAAGQKSAAVVAAAPGKVSGDEEQQIEQEKDTAIFQIQWESLQKQLAAYSQFSAKYVVQIRELKDQQVALEAEYGAKVQTGQATATAAQLKDLQAWGRAVAEVISNSYKSANQQADKDIEDSVNALVRKGEQELAQIKANTERQEQAAKQKSGPASPSIVVAGQAGLAQETAVVNSLTTALQAANDQLKQKGALETDPQVQANLREIDRLTKVLIADQAQLKKTSQDVADSSAQAFAKWGMQMSSTLANAVVGWVNGTETIGRAFAKVAESMVDNALRVAIQGAAAQALGLSSQEATQMRQALTNAKTAATNTYAQVSGWPVVGPFLAPELAAAAFAAVLAFEAGGIVPDTQMALVHKNEMVLPASISEGIQRSMAGSGDGGGKSGSTNHYHFNTTASAVDSVGLDRVLRQNEALTAMHFARQVRRMNR